MAAVERCENSIRCEFARLTREDLAILCERTRTLLNMEPPEGMEWKLVDKVQKSCANCRHTEMRSYQQPCYECINNKAVQYINWELK